MATLEELTARRDALQKAIATGHRSVAYGERRVEYRDMREMREALGLAEAALRDAQQTHIVRRYHFTSEKGL